MNYRSDGHTKLQIYLEKICIASRHFQIKQLLGQVDSDDLSQSLIESPQKTDPVSSLKIGWQERITMQYLVVPIEVSHMPVSFSTLTFSSGNEMVLNSLPQIDLLHGAKVTDFMCRERAHEVFTVSLRLPLVIWNDCFLT